MKVILKYGPFTYTTEMTDPHNVAAKSDIRIMKPVMAPISKPAEGQEFNQLDHHPVNLLFRYTHMLDDDTAEYIFVGEV